GRVLPELLRGEGFNGRGRGPPPAGAAALPGQDCQASTRDRPRASRPLPPALRPSDPKEHWQPPPPAVAWPSSVAHGGPWSPTISPRRNDPQKHARTPFQFK